MQFALVFQASAPCEAQVFGLATSCFVHCDIRHVRADVQRNNTSNAPIAIETQRKEKSICPMGGIMRRTRFKIGSHSCASKRTPGA